MRTKDEQKKQALFAATIKLVNQIGFASSSVSKIAKEAKVSPSTIYVFFKNKEDLLVCTYLELKHGLSKALMSDLDESLPIRDTIKKMWLGIFKYVSNNLEHYAYMEQFSNSPYSELVDKTEIEKEFAPFRRVMEKGIEQKIIKNVNENLLVAFLFDPIPRLANPRFCHGPEVGPEELETAFGMVWDAIRL